MTTSQNAAADWDEPYDTIAELIVWQMIVSLDETGWKVGRRSCDTWVFSTTMHVLFRCGVSRAKTEAATVLGESFAGIGVTDDYAADFIRLQNELMDHPDCLFVFVEQLEVEATNNRGERNARREAEVRKGVRTSKTANGAPRRGVILTVLASRPTRFPRFTLDHLLSEVAHWWETGLSIFPQELAELHQPNAPPILPAET